MELFQAYQRVTVDRKTDHEIFGQPFFGESGRFRIVRDQLASNALLRHFLFDLGKDLRLPTGAFWGGSACVAATMLLPSVNSEHICAPLARLEMRAQEVIEYALVHATVKQLGAKIHFEGLPTIVSSFLESAHFTFAEFNNCVHNILNDDDDLEIDENDRVYFDDDGRGPYSRSPI